MIQKIGLLAFIFCILTAVQSIAQPTVESADGISVTITDTSRIVTIGGAITETVFALGAGSQVIAVDVSSSYPPQVRSLPKVPYLRQLSAEGILSLRPSLIFAGNDASPKTVIYQMRAAGVPVVLIPSEASINGIITKIQRLAKALGKQKEGKRLIADMRENIKKAKKLQQQAEKQLPEVMFILSLRQGAPVIAGKHSSANKMIRLAGGKNVFQSFSDYKAVNAGAIAVANPDIILVMGNQLKKNNREEIERIKQIPGIALTNAAKNNEIFIFDGNYIIGFGPRTGDAVTDLVHIFYPRLN